MQFVGINYKWAGDDPIDGFDCAGFIQELLASVGSDMPGDQTAQNLFDLYFKNMALPKAGALCFYGASRSQVTHVAFMIDNKRIIEAGGGGSKTTDNKAAARDNAFIRIRPYDRRKDLILIAMPD